MMSLDARTYGWPVMVVSWSAMVVVVMDVDFCWVIRMLVPGAKAPDFWWSCEAQG